MVFEELPEIDIKGLEKHLIRLEEKVSHLEAKIDILCWLTDADDETI